MELDEYQQRAVDTTHFKLKEDNGKFITLMGLAGEVGELATEYKKQLRDGEGYTVFKDKLTEELGDILWYLSAIAEHEDLKLNDIAESNLHKTEDRWKDNAILSSSDLLDKDYPLNEQIPRTFSVTFEEVIHEDQQKYISVTWDEGAFGDHLRDNSYDTDFYRFHDVFHLSYAVILGWSPVVRGLMKKKRKSISKIDEVEDGGRAVVIDEAISSLVFENAKKHSYFINQQVVDYSLLRTIKELTKHLEVSIKTGKDWEMAILLGFSLWNKLKVHNGGVMHCDLINRTMTFEEKIGTTYE
ncbi:MazG nucleotide pyrophosphohydrolase domain-containing protein [Psychromonas arctica]|uniref:MazG nucleotide pyrophosphohydrolase domain-containing protein n=1 Tax=Psychromonas arctica TaxID=168275 RepID=A0ABU9HAL6_9GAMM